MICVCVCVCILRIVGTCTRHAYARVCVCVKWIARSKFWPSVCRGRRRRSTVTVLTTIITNNGSKKRDVVRGGPRPNFRHLRGGSIRDWCRDDYIIIFYIILYNVPIACHRSANGNRSRDEKLD